MDHYAVVIYFLAGIGWLYAWHAIVGYDWLRQVPLLWVSSGSPSSAACSSWP